LMPSPEQIEEKDLFLSRFQQTVEGVLEGAVVSPFGSAVNGFWSPNSDIDVCVQIPGCRTRGSQVEALRKIASCLHSISTHYIEPRFGARVPIIHWAPRKEGYLACDISINNNLAVVNSRLVGAYSNIDDRMIYLGMALKHWAKLRGINDRSRGTLSSFSIVLMLIHFLQKRNSPILPSLQDLALELNESPSYCLGSDVRFMSDPRIIEQEMQRLQGARGPNMDSLGQLLHDFFRYYGHEYKQGIIGIRDLRAFHSVSGNSNDELSKPVYLVVDNPFEVGKDVANVSPNQHSRIRQEFRRAASMIQTGATFDEVCNANHPTTVSGPGRNLPGAHPLDPPIHSLGSNHTFRQNRYNRQR